MPYTRPRETLTEAILAVISVPEEDRARAEEPKIVESLDNRNSQFVSRIVHGWCRKREEVVGVEKIGTPIRNLFRNPLVRFA
jgi:hypothetical protein